MLGNIWEQGAIFLQEVLIAPTMWISNFLLSSIHKISPQWTLKTSIINVERKSNWFSSHFHKVRIFTHYQWWWVLVAVVDGGRGQSPTPHVTQCDSRTQAALTWSPGLWESAPRPIVGLCNDWRCWERGSAWRSRSLAVTRLTACFTTSVLLTLASNSSDSVHKHHHIQAVTLISLFIQRP